MLLLLWACDASSPGADAPDRHRQQNPADSGVDSGADTANDTAADTATDTATDGLLCGDGLALGAHEECDGTDDSACPTACSRHCQCPSMPATGEMTLHVIDVGQGDGALLVSPDGFTLLMDAGEESAYESIRQLLDSEGIPGLDYTLVSHQHSDHMGAMDLVLRDHPEVGVAFDGGGRADTDAFRDYRAAAGDRRTTVVTGDELDVGPAMLVSVLHASIGDRDNENNNSVVVRLSHGEVSALVGGDCEFPSCERAIAPGPTDIYKVHHHGSSDSTSPLLLAQLVPSVAIISAGEGNDYGHPDFSTLQELDQAGVEIWRTDHSGTVTVRGDGSTFTVTASR